MTGKDLCRRSAAFLAAGVIAVGLLSPMNVYAGEVSTEENYDETIISYLNDEDSDLTVEEHATEVENLNDDEDEISPIDINSAFKSYDADYTDKGCAAWAKDRVRQVLGIELPATGLNKYGLYGASAYWDKLGASYSRGSEPAPHALAVWEFNYPVNGENRFGHVAFVESVSGNTVILTDGGVAGKSYDGNTGVCYRSLTKSEVATMGQCSGFYGYIYLDGAATHDPQGCLDMATGGEGTVTLSGWAFDRDLPNTSTEVHVYADGGKTYIGKFQANQSSPDVNSAYNLGGSHRFGGTLTTSLRGTHTIECYAINIGGGTTNVMFGSKSVTITDVPAHDPEGGVDSDTGGKAGAIYVKGWAFDRDDLSKALYIDIYLDGEKIQRITADKSRTDINSKYNCGNNHGYEATISTTARGSHKLSIYALNVGGGNHTLLTFRDINIPENTDTTPPTISNVKITDVDDSGFTVNATVTDNVGVSSVKFTFKSPVDDDKTYFSLQGKINGNIATCRFNKLDVDESYWDDYGSYFSLPSNNTIKVEIDAYDAKGNHASSSIDGKVSANPPTISDFKYEITDDRKLIITFKAEDKADGVSEGFIYAGGYLYPYYENGEEKRFRETATPDENGYCTFVLDLAWGKGDFARLSYGAVDKYKNTADVMSPLMLLSDEPNADIVMHVGDEPLDLSGYEGVPENPTWYSLNYSQKGILEGTRPVKKGTTEFVFINNKNGKTLPFIARVKVLDGTECEVSKNDLINSKNNNEGTYSLSAGDGDDAVDWQIGLDNLDAEALNNTTSLEMERHGNNGGNIPEAAISNLISAALRSVEQIDFAHKGAFGFTATCQMSILTGSDAVARGASGAGSKAVLLRYVGGDFVLTDSSAVESQKMSFEFSEGDDYAVVYSVNGDVDGDGEVSVKDVQSTLKHTTGRKTLTPLEVGIGDVSGANGRTHDNQVNISDVQKLLKYVSRRISEL